MTTEVTPGVPPVPPAEPQDPLVRLQRTVALSNLDAAGGLHLLDYADEFVALDALYAMDDGEVTAEHEALERELLTKAAQKTDRYLAMMRLHKARADFCADEIKRLSARKAAAEAKVDRMTRYALIALERMGATKIEGVTGYIRWQWSAPKAAIEADPMDLPDDYIRIVPSSIELDRRAILDALKRGEEIPGCSLVREKSVRWSK